MRAPNDDLYARLMALNRDAFAQPCYATAYHTLVAALQRAMHLGAPALICQVHAVAKAQMTRLGAEVRTARLGSRGALCHYRDLYAALVEQADTHARLNQTIRQHARRAPYVRA